MPAVDWSPGSTGGRNVPRPVSSGRPGSVLPDHLNGGGGSSSGPSSVGSSPGTVADRERNARTPREWMWRGGRPNNSMSVDYQQGLWNDSRNAPSLSRAYRKWWDDNLEAIRSQSPTKFKSGRTAYKYSVQKAASLGMSVNEYAAYAFGISFDGSDGTPTTGDVPLEEDGGGGYSYGGGGGGGGGGGNTVRQTRVDLTDPTTARSLINRTISDSLGRLATEEEIRKFTDALNSAEKSNPQTAVSVDRGNSSSTVTGGGIDREQVLLDQVRDGAEYQAFNTDSVFRQAMSILAGRGV